MLSSSVSHHSSSASPAAQSDVIRNVIGALMSTAQLAPNFWIDPSSGNPYVIGVQYPEDIVGGIETLETIPITGRSMETFSMPN